MQQFNRKIIALIGVSGAALAFSSHALAADNATSDSSAATSNISNSNSNNQDSEPNTTSETPNTTDEIVVYGKGSTRQVQEIQPSDIAILAPGSSPLVAIQKLPSVNFQSADPFGSYEWSTRITIRGFSQNQLGFNLDGIPLGDMSYGNHNGLHVSRAISSANIGSTLVSQGSGSITAQATTNLGGTLEFFSIDPADAKGVDANITYGSHDMKRGFVRAGFGDVGALRGFVSAQFQDNDKWKGEGVQRQAHYNAKVIVPVGEGELDGYFSHSRRAEQDYQDMSLKMIKNLGYKWDNFGTSNYATAVLVADIAANRKDTSVTPTNPDAGKKYPGKISTPDDAYANGSGLRRDTIASLGLTLPIGEGAEFKVKGYMHKNRGQGTWGTPYQASPNGVPISVRTTEYNIDRKGIFTSINAEKGDHEITFGGWYEGNDFSQARRFYAYESRTSPGTDHLSFFTNPFKTSWDIEYNTETLQYYVQDTISMGDATLKLGWKGFKVDNASNPIVLGGRTMGKLTTKDWFQPHVGYNYDMGNGMELFSGFTSVTRAHIASTTQGPFSSTQDGFDAIKPVLKPESSNTYETGVRLNMGDFDGVIAAYRVDFKNRLLTIPTSVGIVGAANALKNVGDVRSLGLEVTGSYKFSPEFSAFASYSYNRNRYLDNVVFPKVTPATETTPAISKTIIIPTRNQTVVDSPEHLMSLSLDYDNDSLFGSFTVNYMSKRYFTYTNDMKEGVDDGLANVGGRAILNATLGYRFDIASLSKPVEIQLNAANLLDKKYISTLGSNGYGNVGDNQGFQIGAPRQVFVSLKMGF